jgi:hypothetical protein
MYVYVRMYVCMYVSFSTIIHFFRVPLNVLVRTPGGPRTQGWESLT